MGSMSPSYWAAQASASSASTTAALAPVASHSPFTAHTPMRTPVKEPGPVTAANTSISFGRSPSLLNNSSSIGMSVWEWVSPLLASLSPLNLPSVISATEQAREAVSSAHMFKRIPPKMV